MSSTMGLQDLVLIRPQQTMEQEVTGNHPSPDISEAIGRGVTHEREFRKGLLRSSVRSCRLLKQYWYDFLRFRRCSSAVGRGDSREKLSSLITMAYHSLEKGMSLPSPRPGFGIRHVETLLCRLHAFGERFGYDPNCRVACNVLRRYQEMNTRSGLRMPRLAQALDVIDEAIQKTGCAFEAGGSFEITREEFLRASAMDLGGFFAARSSVRQFAEGIVPLGQLQKAVGMAQKTPCVCNRQSSKVRAYAEPRNVRDALRIQGGAAGFADQVPTVLVISSDLSHFQSPGERYQCWIDGGLFAMSLIYALHSLGLVSCCLNWSKDADVDRCFKDRFGIPDGDSIIMLLAVGNPAEHFRVAQSWRRPLGEVFESDYEKPQTPRL